MENVSGEVAPGALLLDAGAGHRPYRHLLRHTDYQSCDFLPVLEEVGGNTGIDHTFYCDLENIPKADTTYDVIICNQVLEHMKRPGRAISEFHRVLKPGGQLYVTVPQCFGVHMSPYNYFNFLDGGLRFLFEEAGFRVAFIEPLGGIFWLLGKVTEKAYGCLFPYIRPTLRGLFFPLHLCIRVLLFVFFFVLFHLDRFDREKGWTLNYGCCCIKPSREDGK
jgi:SAM-dependent methyltransferase